ncbi:MAG: hypothetical protein IPO93_08740 [Actinobacteria bacterium]|jgi:hypothetical protein|nr:hypothetical protein [Actinomycetota bacterium]
MSDGYSPSPASARRQLRFSLFLQAFAALMMGGAAVVRIVAFGWDVVTILLTLAFGLIIAAGAYTWRRLRTMDPPAP